MATPDFAVERASPRRNKVAVMTTPAQNTKPSRRSSTRRGAFRRRRRSRRKPTRKPGIYEEAERDSEAWWTSWARKLEWMKPFTQGARVERAVRDAGSPTVELNASVNALDRHVRNGLAARRSPTTTKASPATAGRSPTASCSTRCAGSRTACASSAIKKGDRVAIYMPMIVELPVAMLACARIGAAHSVIFGGFSPDAIVDRVNDAQCVALITADQGWRRGKQGPAQVQLRRGDREGDAVAQARDRRAAASAIRSTMVAGRDHWWDDVVAGSAVDVRARAR